MSKNIAIELCGSTSQITSVVKTDMEPGFYDGFRGDIFVGGNLAEAKQLTLDYAEGDIAELQERIFNIQALRKRDIQK